MHTLGLYSRVLGLMKSEQSRALLLAAGAIFNGFFLLSQVALFGWFVQALVDNNSPSAVLIVWIVASLLFVGTSLLVTSQASQLGHRARLNAMTRFFEQNISASSGFASARARLDRMRTIMLRGVDQIFFLANAFFREHLPAFIILVLSVPLAFYACWQLAILLYALLICLGILGAVLLHKAFAAQEQVETAHARLDQRIADSMGKAMIVQSYGRLAGEMEDVTRATQDLLGAEFPVMNAWTRRHVLATASGALVLAIMAACSLSYYTSNSASIGDVVIFAGLSVLLSACVWRLVSAANLLLFDKAPIAAFFALLDAQAALSDVPDAKVFVPGQGQIVFDNVDFHAPGETNLTNFNLTILPHEKVAFTSTDGSTSTLPALLMRFADPLSGAITIDGQNVHDVRLQTLREKIALVSAHVSLFSRSVMENLRVGLPTAKQNDVIDAVRRSGAHDFIAAKQHGFHSIVDDSFSAPQQRALNVSRAIIKDAPIVVVEQSDTGIDDDAAAIAALIKNKTALIFSTQPDVLKLADRIVVMKNGMIEQVGLFSELKL